MATGSVVQAEFFLEDGPRLKQTIRLWDTEGHITLVSLEIMTLDQEKRYYLTRLGYALRANRWFETKYCRYRLRRLDLYLLYLHEQKIILVKQRFSQACRFGGSIAIEQPDRRFRVANWDELPSLARRIVNSQRMWLFIFESDLLSTDAKPVLATVF